jgi:hypothetical protein
MKVHSIPGGLRRAALRALGAVALSLMAPLASAAYFVWETVELPASTGAACGNGTPYRFFVNRTPFTQDTSLMHEGGGACWDQASCLGQGKLSASNPNGIPASYLSEMNTAAFGLITPFTARIHPFQGVRTQGWNLVYLPYCTGDVHTGSKLTVYSDADPANPRVQHHRGQANIRAAANWLRANLGRPNQLLLTGFSAGGVGSTATYSMVRDTLAPTGRVSLLADSGPLFPAPRAGTPEQYPSLPLHNKIRSAWGLDEPGGLVSTNAGMPGFDTNNLGSINVALAQRYPSDRFGFVLFGADYNYSDFSYAKFYSDIANAGSEDVRKQRILQRWQQDITQWLPVLATQPNIAWHAPYFRNFNDSHCLTIIDFSGTAIEEKNVASLTPFIDNTLDRGTPMRNREFDQVSDLSRPVSVGMTILSYILALFG